jgi:type II secretory pathway component HofQ
MIGLTSGQALDSSLESSGIHPTSKKRAETLTFGIVEANPARLPLFKELVEEGIVNVLARPTLMTTTGRPASLHIGGEVPVRVQSSNGEVSIRSLPFGTHVEVLATVLPNHGVRLRMAFEKREINSEKTVGDDSTSYPEVQSRRINTELELKLGQTAVLVGLIVQRHVESEATEDHAAVKAKVRRAARSDETSDTTQTIVFVTPQLVNSPIVPRALHRVPDTDDESSEVIEPAIFEPVDWDLFGPPVPVLRRGTSRD